MRRETRGGDAEDMKRGKGIIALVAATAGLGVAAIPATAELHRVTVILVNGQRVVTTVDVPPGTPVTSVAIPGIVGPIKTVIDNGPVSVPTPSATTPPVPTPKLPAPSTPTPDGNDTPGAPNRTEGGAQGGGGDQGTGSTGSVRHTGTRTTRAGSIKGKGKQGKDLIGDLQKAARKKASKK